MRGYFLVFLAAAMWGTLGLFFTALHDFGVQALTIAFLRAAVPGAILFIVLLVTDHRALVVSRGALAFFALFGLVGIAAFYIVNVEAVILTNVPTASVMLYTAPAWVTLFAWRVWGESLTGRKILALVVVWVGILLVARFYDPAQIRLNGAGTFVAISTGIAYALYTIFSKFAVKQHAPTIAVMYSLLFGALFLLPTQFLPIPARDELVGEGFAPLARNQNAWVILAGLCFGPTLGSYVLYNVGLRHIPASNASVVASVEPVVAALLGWFVLGQMLEIWQWVGGILIVASAVWLSLQKAV